MLSGLGYKLPCQAHLDLRRYVMARLLFSHSTAHDVSWLLNTHTIGDGMLARLVKSQPQQVL